MLYGISSDSLSFLLEKFLLYITLASLSCELISHQLRIGPEDNVVCSTVVLYSSGTCTCTYIYVRRYLD